MAKFLFFMRHLAAPDEMYIFNNQLPPQSAGEKLKLREQVYLRGRRARCLWTRLLEGLEEEEPGQVLLLDFAEDEEGEAEA